MKKNKNYSLRQLLLLLSFFVLSITVANAQTTVTGTVSDSDGNSLPGVNVIIKGTVVGSITDLDGKFSIEVSSESDILMFSMVGMLTEEIPVGSQTTIDVSLIEDLVGLDEVVVVGYGTARKKDLTGSVGSVGAADFENQTIRDVDQILQGRSAGVTVTRASGGPGGDAKIRIRGSNSINGNNDPLYVIDGFVGGDFGALNPGDIADVQILKDASSTAIYGSRGANGVVIVTTKSGEKGAIKVNFETNYSISKVIKEWDMLSAVDYVNTSNEYNDAISNARDYDDDETAYWNSGVDGGTDWQDEVFRTAYGREFILSLSGGDDKSKYFVSLNHLNQDGIVINSNFKRYSFRGSVTSNVTDKLKLKVNTSFNRREDNNVAGGGGFRGTLSQMTAWAPTAPARNDDGSINTYDGIGSIWENPLETGYGDRERLRNNFNLTFGATYKIIPGLTYDLNIGADLRNNFNNNYTMGILDYPNNPKTPSVRRQSTEIFNGQLTNMLTYKKVFANIHRLDVTAVAEQQISTYDEWRVDVSGLTFPEFRYFELTQNAGTSAFAQSNSQQLNSYIGRINYQLLDRYMVTAAIRSDASSKFQPDNRQSFFPSAAIGWVISEESFMPDGIFDNLKLRASYGKTGSQAINPYATQTAFNSTDPVPGRASFANGVGTPGLVLGDPGNTILSWETTDQFNVGLDMAFFRGRLNITADAYQKNTYDLLLETLVPFYAGGGEYFQNKGEVLNKGLEFSIGGDIIKTSDWTWNSSFNYSYLHNEVTNVGDVDEIPLSNISGDGRSSFPDVMLRPGYSLSAIYGLTYLGTWKEGEEDLAAVYGQVPGDARFLDRQHPDSAGYGTIDGDDADIIGDGIASGSFGWNNTITYKDFTLNFFFQAMTGFDRLNQTYAQMMMLSQGGDYPTHSDINDRWDAETNPGSDIPHFSPTANQTEEIQSSRFVEDASFVRLRNLSLSYRLRLPETRSVVFMVSGQNLLTFTKYRGIDPEVFSDNSDDTEDSKGVDISTYPNSRSVTFSLKLNF